MSLKPCYYAVRRGRMPGVYSTWNECLKQVYKFKGSEFQKFYEKTAALQFLTVAEAAGKTRAPVACADGGSRGNPGPGGCGVVLYNTKGRKIASFYKRLGIVTNNQAEYLSLIHALHIARSHLYRTLEVQVDSLLVVKQVAGSWKVKEPELQRLHSRVQRLLQGFSSVQVRHIPRSANSEADGLANLAMDLSYS